MRIVYEIIDEKRKKKQSEEEAGSKNKSNKLLVFKKYMKREIRNQRKTIGCVIILVVILKCSLFSRVFDSFVRSFPRSSLGQFVPNCF